MHLMVVRLKCLISHANRFPSLSTYKYDTDLIVICFFISFCVLLCDVCKFSCALRAFSHQTTELCWKLESHVWAVSDSFVLVYNAHSELHDFYCRCSQWKIALDLCLISLLYIVFHSMHNSILFVLDVLMARNEICLNTDSDSISNSCNLDLPNFLYSFLAIMDVLCGWWINSALLL